MTEAKPERRIAELEGDEREYVRLSRFLTRAGAGDGFGLGLASYRDPIVARELRAKLRGELEPEHRVGEMTCVHDDGVANLVGRLVTASEGLELLFVVGLDHLLLDSGGRPRMTVAIANLNARRDELPELLETRVVLWVSQAGAQSLAAQAWDLVQVVLTTAQFTSVASVPIPGVDAVFDPPSWAEPAPPDERAALEAQAHRLAAIAVQARGLTQAAGFGAQAARLFARAGRDAEAGEWLLATARWFDRSGLLWSAGSAYRTAAELMLARGDFSSALALAERAIHRTPAPAELARANVCNDMVEDQVAAYGVTCEVLARARAARGELRSALWVWLELLELYERAGWPRAYADVLGELAELHRGRGELDAALLIRRGHQLPILRALEPSDELSVAIARARGGVASVLEQRGALVEALELRQREQLPVFEQLCATRDHARTLARIADIREAQGDQIEAQRIRAVELPTILEP